MHSREYYHHSEKNIMKKVRDSKGKEESPEKLNALRFIFSIYVEGSSYSDVGRIFAWNDIVPPSETTFYRYSDIVENEIVKMAQESCEEAKKTMSEQGAVGVDGSWSQKRDGIFCFLAIVDVIRKKVIDFYVNSHTLKDMKGNFQGPSNMMEHDLFLEFVHDYLNEKNIKVIVHDNDAKTSTAIKEAGWHVLESIDINHAIKCFHVVFEKFCYIQEPEKTNQNKTKRVNLLYGLEERLCNWLKYILRLDDTHQHKVELWLNSLNHFRGDHTKCIHPKGEKFDFTWRYKDNEIAIDKLRHVLFCSCRLIYECKAEFNTNLNESLNALKAHFAGKITAWHRSFISRCAAAVLQFNDPSGDWRFELYERLQLPPLSEKAHEYLEKREHIATHLHQKRADDEWKKEYYKSEKARHEEMFSTDKSTKEHYTGKPFHICPSETVKEEEVSLDDIDFSTLDERGQKFHETVTNIRNELKHIHLFDEVQIAIAFHRCCGLNDTVMRFLNFLADKPQEVINEELDVKWLSEFPDIGPVEEYYQ